MNDLFDEYLKESKALGELVVEKQKAYGDSFGKAGQVMRILYPNGITSEQMDDALALTRIIDKLFRIATAKDALGESPYRDIMGYALLGSVRHNNEKQTNNTISTMEDYR